MKSCSHIFRLVLFMPSFSFIVSSWSYVCLKLGGRAEQRHKSGSGFVVTADGSGPHTLGVLADVSEVEW